MVKWEVLNQMFSYRKTLSFDTGFEISRTILGKQNVKSTHPLKFLEVPSRLHYQNNSVYSKGLYETEWLYIFTLIIHVNGFLFHPRSQ